MVVHILLDCGKSAGSKEVGLVVHLSLWSVKGSRLRCDYFTYFRSLKLQTGFFRTGWHITATRNNYMVYQQIRMKEHSAFW